MAITKEKKAQIIAKLESAVQNAKTLVFVGFKGITVADTTTMRSALREQGVGYMVAKKTLIKRVLDQMGLGGTYPDLPGEVALVYGADDIAPARGVRDFEKKFKEQIAILGGVFEGRFMDKAAMTEVASIPPVDTLRGMFVNVVNSPIQGLVIALSAIAEKKS